MPQHLLVSVLCCAVSAIPAWEEARSQVQFDTLPLPSIQQHLSQYRGNYTQREAALKQMFLEAGCIPGNLDEQAVPKRKQPNLRCVLPGGSDDVIIVGAHFDHADAGDGVVDNWSGVSLLPSLLHGLRGVPRRHTFWFVGFTGEESGLLGSDFFVRGLTADQLAHVDSMINLDTLGLGPTLTWNQQSDPVLLNVLGSVAKSMSLPVAGMNLNGAGNSDEESFIAAKVCTLTVHSLTPQTLHILHSKDDTPRAIQMAEYYKTYRLLLGFLAALDAAEIPKHACSATAVEADGRPRSGRSIGRP